MSVSNRVWFPVSDPSCDLQRAFPSMLSIDGELSKLVDQAAALLKPWPIGLDLKPQKTEIFTLHPTAVCLVGQSAFLNTKSRF